MARTPKATTKRQSTRPARSAAPVSYKNEDDFDPVQDEDLPDDEDMDMDGGSEDSAEMLNRFLIEYKKREAKKVSARTAAFQTQKKALYASARKQAKDLAREATACLEEGKARVLALKNDEVRANKFSDDVVPIWHDIEDSTRGLLTIYPAGFKDLFPRRSNAINAASEMLRANATTRSEALADCVEKADFQLYKSKQDEMVAADASRLIKQVKTLLMT